MSDRAALVNARAVSLRRRLALTYDDTTLERRLLERPASPTAPALPVFVWTHTRPPADRRCSRGCHLLPETARFDPHTGAPLHGSGTARSFTVQTA